MTAFRPRRSAVSALSGRLGLAAVVLCGFVWPALGAAQGRTTAIKVTATDAPENGVVRETVLFPGWDPYEPVPAFVYRKPEAKQLPVVIFIHGMGADKTWQA